MPRRQKGVGRTRAEGLSPPPGARAKSKYTPGVEEIGEGGQVFVENAANTRATPQHREQGVTLPGARREEKNPVGPPTVDCKKAFGVQQGGRGRTASAGGRSRMRPFFHALPLLEQFAPQGRRGGAVGEPPRVTALSQISSTSLGEGRRVVLPVSGHP